MKYRYLVERLDDEYRVDENDEYTLGPTFTLTRITRSDTSGSSFGRYPTVEAAKAAALTDTSIEDELRWRDPPVEWQPDAVAMSGWIDDDIPDNSDR